MLSWSLAFLIFAIAAGAWGFGGSASAAADMAKVAFFIFLILFGLSLIFRSAEAADDEIQKTVDK